MSEKYEIFCPVCGAPMNLFRLKTKLKLVCDSTKNSLKGSNCQEHGIIISARYKGRSIEESLTSIIKELNLKTSSHMPKKG